MSKYLNMIKSICCLNYNYTLGLQSTKHIPRFFNYNSEMGSNSWTTFYLVSEYLEKESYPVLHTGEDSPDLDWHSLKI